VWLADLHGSKSVGITPRLLRYFIYYCRGAPMCASRPTSLAVWYGYNRTYKSTVGTGVPDCPLNRLLPYATTTLFQARSARGFFRAFFRRPKERTKESAKGCGAKTSRRTAKGSLSETVLSPLSRFSCSVSFLKFCTDLQDAHTSLKILQSHRRRRAVC